MNQTNFGFSQNVEEVALDLVKDDQDLEEFNGRNIPNTNSRAALLSSFLSMIQAQEEKIFPLFHSDKKNNGANSEKMKEKTLSSNKDRLNGVVEYNFSTSGKGSNPTNGVLSLTDEVLSTSGKGSHSIDGFLSTGSNGLNLKDEILSISTKSLNPTYEVLSTSGKNVNRTLEKSLDISSSTDILEVNLSTVKNYSNGTTMSTDKGLLKNMHRRFLSNVHASLKHHIKNAEDWAMSKKEAGELFEVYYTCLQDKLAALKSEEFPIKTVMAIEGEKVMMDCKVCFRPDRDEESQRANWQVLRHEDTALQRVHVGGKFHVTKDSSLVITGIDVNDAGQYFCVEEMDYAAVYQVDVFLTDRRKHIKLGQDVPQADVYLVQQNLQVFTMWAAWSECNTCDRQGQKFRVGQCTVKKLYQDTPVFPRDYPIMMFYKEGVPCHSTAVPRHLRNLPEIGLRYSETQVTFCMEPCPTIPPSVSITDETGKVIEVLEPGYFPLDAKPQLPPLVKRKVLYEPLQSHLVLHFLHCPGDLDVSVVHWARGERGVDPASIRHQTKGRVWVDSLSRLHINPLILSDTAVYNCWCKKRRVASIKVLVVNESNKKIKHYISFCGLITTCFGSFLFVFCICCKKSDKNAR
ncbi:uncharacterized protein LOC131937708 [Physella acuta]|uniref:uncharacterized protein LOC131937708 n=1 Tax=Physella acuta TaxID=109671 RepID=UPI0027DADB9C|nr:uncharacterized protein LOC131937708 [Physella acuta]